MDGTMVVESESRNYAYWGDPANGPQALEDFFTSTPRLLAVDIETVSLEDTSITGIGVAVSRMEAFYFPVDSIYFGGVIGLLWDPEIKKVFHNCLFDLPILEKLGVDAGNIADTITMAYLLGLPAKLEDLSHAVDIKTRDMGDVLKEHGVKETTGLPYRVLAEKCVKDVLATYRLYHELGKYIDSAYFAREMRLIPVLRKISARGIKLDHEVVEHLHTKYSREVETYRLLSEGEGFNPASPQQVAYILAQRGNYLKVKRSGRGKWSMPVDELVLEKLDDPIAALVVNYRKVAKLLSTYIVPYRSQDRAYTRLHNNTATGRLASTKRNLQNIPKGEMRGMFLPDFGTFTDFDYSQQELRTLAYVSGDREMTFLFTHGTCVECGYLQSNERKHCDRCAGRIKDLDMHQDNADFMGIDRRTAKNTTFSMLYGGSAQTIMETAGIRSLDRAKELRRMWFGRFQQAGDWIEATVEEGLRTRQAKTMQGRILWLPLQGEESDEDVARKCVNYPIQGSAAEITKEAMLRCKDLDMVLQVHDELLLDGYVPEEEIKRLGVEEVAPFRTPVDVKYMGRWM